MQNSPFSDQSCNVSFLSNMYNNNVIYDSVSFTLPIFSKHLQVQHSTFKGFLFARATKQTNDKNDYYYEDFLQCLGIETIESRAQ